MLPMVRGIKYIAALPPGGYAEAAKRAILGLARAGVPLTFQPLVAGTAWGMNLELGRGDRIADPQLAPWCNRTIEYDTVIVHAPPELFPAVRAIEPGKRLIGATVWETDRLLPQWLPWLDSADVIVVPCEWNRAVFAASGVRRPIRVVPHIEPHPIPDAAAGSVLGADLQGRFVFYSIGMWSSRKGGEALVRAFLTAFRGDEPVALLLKTGPRNLTRQRPWIWPRTTRGAVAQIRRRVRSKARIRLVTEAWSDAQMMALHAQANCYVSLPHAEGWGLGSFDAAAAGRPVITTGYGGPLAYLGEDYPFLVKNRVGPARGRGFERFLFLPDQQWAFPDEADAARKMRQVFAGQAEAAAQARSWQARIRARFNADTVTAELLQAVQMP